MVHVRNPAGHSTANLDSEGPMRSPATHALFRSAVVQCTAWLGACRDANPAQPDPMKTPPLVFRSTQSITRRSASLWTRHRAWITPLTAVIAATFASACATTGATFQSGVADAFPDHPPYYAGATTTPAAQPGARVGVLPLYYQPGAAQPALFDPRWGPGTPLHALLSEMNATLDSLTTSRGEPLTRLIDGARVSAVAPTSLGVPPDVMFGCLTRTNLPDDECEERDGALGRGRQQMRLAVGRPSKAWIAWAGSTMDAAGVSHVLVISLEVAEYPVRQRGLAGAKSVELGTNHTVSLPWLTSLDTPVQVVQLTGALIDRNGRAVRIGAEGLVARRTRLLLSALGAQALIGDTDIASLRTQRRDDVAGAPLVWREALRELVAQLTR